MAPRRKFAGYSDEEFWEELSKYPSANAYATAVGCVTSTIFKEIRLRNLEEKYDEHCSKEVTPTAEISDEDLLLHQVKELQARVTSSRKEDIQQERTLRRLEDAITSTNPKYKPGKFVKSKKNEEHEFALLFSDTHAYEVVKPEETLGMNAYNGQIMLERMERLRKSVLSYQAHRPYPVKTLNLWMLGDMLSGDIHDELSETNELNGAESVVQFAIDTAAWIEEFVPYFEKIRVLGVPGNHPRAKRKPQAKNAHNNGDWLAYKMMEMLHADVPSIEYSIPVGSWAATYVAERWHVLLMHGDGIRSSMPGVPWGGVVRRVTAIEQQFNHAGKPIDYVALGHFHTANALDGVGVKVLMNGSVKGIDEYSLKAFGSGRPPAQLLLTFNQNHGLTDVSYIDLEEVIPAGERITAYNEKQSGRGSLPQ